MAIFFLIVFVVFFYVRKWNLKRFRSNLKPNQDAMYYDKVLVKVKLITKTENEIVFYHNEDTRFGKLKNVYPLWCEKLFIL